jgi:hypothetical protein
VGDGKNGSAVFAITSHAHQLFAHFICLAPFFTANIATTGGAN